MLWGRMGDTGIRTVPPLCPFSQGCVQVEYLFLAEAGSNNDNWDVLSFSQITTELNAGEPCTRQAQGL